jgi:hypothetical protein
MPSLTSVFQVLNQLRDEGVIEDYALGGGMAVLFYAEPTPTYDLDVFVLLPPSAGPIVRMTPIYERLQAEGFTTDMEHILIHGVPVQFLPAYNELVDEAVEQARTIEYDGVPVRVVRPEHLVALAIQTGGRKRRERAELLLESGEVDEAELDRVLSRFGLAMSQGKSEERP